MSDPKLNLSKREKVLLTNAEIFYAKNEITQKIYSQLALVVKRTLEEKIFTGLHFPKGTDAVTGKISKGENYLGLPYFMLDFPRLFSKDETFAIRTMVWWGKFYSNTLLIDGDLVSTYQKKIVQSKKLLDKNEVYWGIGESPWHHHFEEDNMVLTKEFSTEEFKSKVKRASFLKCGRKNGLEKMDDLVEFSLESFQTFARLVKL